MRSKWPDIQGLMSGAIVEAFALSSEDHKFPGDPNDAIAICTDVTFSYPCGDSKI